VISVADNAASQTPAPIKVFVYATTEKAPLYRSIMRAFTESKERFVFQLLQQEVFDFIRMAGLPETPEQTEVESALGQLCDWGNLQADVDTTAVRSVEDFYDQRHTFRMTAQGEAAERALTGFSMSSGDEGAPGSCGIADIRLVFQKLRQLSGQAEPDAGKIHRQLVVLRALFEDLSKTAQTFIARLEQRLDLQPADARHLIDYGQQFIDELVLEADTIAEAIRDIEAAGIERLLGADVCRKWRSHWAGFRLWFIAEPGFPSYSERLRERARASIPALLSIVSRINDQRSLRIDRAGDFRVLARWFAQAGSDAEAHLLWRAAFGLCPARHLLIDELRNYRGNARTLGLSRMIDRSAEKERLAAACHEEAQRLLNAQQRFGTGNRIRLSELEHLETREFELFLELLGEAISARVFDDQPVEILSGDGCLRIRLEPTADGREALILTTDGILSGPDHWIRIEPISTNDLEGVLM